MSEGALHEHGPEVAARDGHVLPKVIELKDVSKRYATPGQEPRLAITDINLAISDVPGRGQCRVILGPSGCGKSTIRGWGGAAWTLWNEAV